MFFSEWADCNQCNYFFQVVEHQSIVEYNDRQATRLLTLKAPLTTAADNKLCEIFPHFRKKYGMVFHENRLPADDSHEISCLICYY